MKDDQMSRHRYFQLNTCYLKDYDLGLINDPPDKVRHVDFMLMWGERMGELYPSDRMDACIFLDPDYGMKLSGLMSNTCRHLIVSTPIKEVIRTAFVDPRAVEIFPVAIYDQKKRLADDGYFYINPIGTVDCLDQRLSVIKRTEEGEVISVKKKVLDARSIDPAVKLFRPKEAPSSYIIRHDLLMTIKDLNLPIPNIYVDELEVTGDAP